MGRVSLSDDGTEVAVLLEAPSDLVALRAAFRDTPGAIDPSRSKGLEDLDLYVIPLGSLGDIRALWAAGFSWEERALRALVDRLLPAARGGPT